MRNACIPVLVSAALLSACNAQNGVTLPTSNVRADARQGANPNFKIYVANIGSGTITTYDPDGTQTKPTINTGNYLYAIAVSPAGKIYAVTFNPQSRSKFGTITSYKPNGTQTWPTIAFKESGYSTPSGLAVDGSGKIYLLNSGYDGLRGKVTTYNAEGKRTSLTFRTGPDSSNIAVGLDGKIYVTNDTGPGGHSSVTTYLPDGSPTKPTITHDVQKPDAVAVADNGTIFVANTNNRGHDGTEAGALASYSAGGKGPIVNIRDGQAPGGLATAYGKVYLVSSDAYTSTLKTYTLDGKQVSPTITQGLDEPSGVAVH